MTKTAKNPPASPLQAEFEAAAALQRQGNNKAAIQRYARLLEKMPDHPQVLNMCAVATSELGDVNKAIKLLKRATETAPTFAESWLNLGLLQQKKGNHAAACQAYDILRQLVPDSPVGHTNYANACQLLDRFDEAVAAYEAALALNKSDHALWSNYARACHYNGNWEKALDAANRAIAMKQRNTGAMAVKSAALLELGSKEELSSLVDFDRLIEVADFSPPHGYADLNAFNEALCVHCLNHPSLVFEPSENTTKLGYQSGNLSRDDNQGPIAHLLEMIGKAVRTYQQTHPADPAHPFLSAPPDKWSYDIWATILGSQGHQAPHIHRSGWLSGCYYVKIPDAVSLDNEDKAGWIEFGRPQKNSKTRAEPRVRAYKPHEGLVVLFPSYFYHRTIPFESDDKRISIAFDIVPAK